MVNYMLSIILMLGESGADGEQGYSTFIFLGLIFVVFYFFMIRPQMKKQKNLRKAREEMKKGDTVVTTGGIYGKIADIKETTITIEVDDKVRLKVDKNSIFTSPADLVQQK